MTDWHAYWSTNPQQFGTDEYLKQVGKTVGGVPISPAQFASLTADVCNGLDLQPEDRLLDLCCGNGLITATLASRCQSIVGVDYSPSLLEVARRDHQPENVEYHELSVRELSRLAALEERPFNKVLMYEALQHFAAREFEPLLASLRPLTTNDARMFFGSIPDRGRWTRFANTPRRKLVLLYRYFTGTSPIATWWRTERLEESAARQNCRAEFVPQSPDLHTAHYRFDMILHKLSVATSQ